jgi:hypothetical protein
VTDKEKFEKIPAKEAPPKKEVPAKNTKNGIRP